MDDSHARKFQKDLNAGLVALVLLAVLDQTSEDLYGYEIAKRLQRRTRAKPSSRKAPSIPCSGLSARTAC